MLLLIGLGNPGPDHAGNRHNIGFMAIDAIARAHRLPAFRAKFQGVACEGMIGEARVLLLKPQTFMNESGRSVGEAARFLKIAPADCIVVHDELDLGAGRLRVKTGGGNAGHNGLRSITAHIGNDYRRVRIGIGHPGDKARVHGYVLGDFAKNEAGWTGAMCAAIAAETALLLAGEDATFQNRIDLAMKAVA